MNDVNKAMMMPPTECTSVKIYYPVEIVFQFHQKPGQLLVFHFMLQDVDRGQLNEKIPNKNINNNNCVWDMISPKETITPGKPLNRNQYIIPICIRMMRYINSEMDGGVCEISLEITTHGIFRNHVKL